LGLLAAQLSLGDDCDVVVKIGYGMLVVSVLDDGDCVFGAAEGVGIACLC